MARPQQHLAQVVRSHGSGNATAELRAILRNGLQAMEAEKQAARIELKGTAAKTNPYISDAGRCIRQVTFSLMNIEPSEPYTEDALMNFLVGHAVEEAWAQVLIGAGATFVREERVEIPIDGTKVTGRKDFDGIRLLWQSSIVELKSTNSRSMAWTLKRGDQGKPDHRRQLNLYLHASRMEVGYLVYLVKDATKGEPILHAWAVDYDEEQALADLEAMAMANALAQIQRPPAIPEGMKQSAYPCSYCSYRTHCWLAASIAQKEAANV
jgi:CRISPR/Cas system-associated exonuclease Cas4 (RecB family)